MLPEIRRVRSSTSGKGKMKCEELYKQREYVKQERIEEKGMMGTLACLKVQNEENKEKCDTR